MTARLSVRGRLSDRTWLKVVDACRTRASSSVTTASGNPSISRISLVVVVAREIGPDIPMFAPILEGRMCRSTRLSAVRVLLENGDQISDPLLSELVILREALEG